MRRSFLNMKIIARLPKKFLYAYFAILVVIAGLIIIWSLNFSRLEEIGPYSVVGSPSISADFINRVLDTYHSPAAGKGQALYDDGIKYGIDPAFALAFFMQESSFGTQGVATVTHSLGNIRASQGEPQYHGYRLYRTWEEGFEDW